MLRVNCPYTLLLIFYSLTQRVKQVKREKTSPAFVTLTLHYTLQGKHGNVKIVFTFNTLFQSYAAAKNHHHIHTKHTSHPSNHSIIIIHRRTQLPLQFFHHISPISLYFGELITREYHHESCC